MANNTRIGNKAVTAIQNYIDDCPKLNHDIRMNDTIPAFDGDILVYKENNSNKIENYLGPVRIQVKGSTDSKEYYTIEREHVRVFENAGGCIFFKVLEIEEPSDKLTVSKILYNILYLDDITQLLKKDTKNLRIQLKEMPTNDVFEEEVSKFAKSIGRQKVEQSSKKEIESLVNGFVELEKHYDEIYDQEARFELESQIRTIKSLTDDGSVLWRNKFYYHSRKAIDIAINNIEKFDFAGLQFKLGKYLQKQKQYHLVEDYYLKALEECRKRSDKVNMATTLNNLAILHSVLTRYDKAEKEFNMALNIRLELAKTNRDAYIGYVADTLNNLANLHKGLTRYDEAEKEYKVALKIYCKLAKANRNAYIGDVAMTLNNLAALHFDLTRYDEAEKENKDALKIRRELAETNHDAYIADVAETLNNLAALHYRLKNYEAAEKKYNDSLEIYRELAKTNRDAYIGDVAQTLNNLGILHRINNRYGDAKTEFEEALIIRRELAKTNRDAYIGDAAKTLVNFAVLQAFTNYTEAKETAEEALDIYKELAKAYPQIWEKEVEDTERLLSLLQKIEELSKNS